MEALKEKAYGLKQVSSSFLLLHHHLQCSLLSVILQKEDYNMAAVIPMSDSLPSHLNIETNCSFLPPTYTIPLYKFLPNNKSFRFFFVPQRPVIPSFINKASHRKIRILRSTVCQSHFTNGLDPITIWRKEGEETGGGYGGWWISYTVS